MIIFFHKCYRNRFAKKWRIVAREADIEIRRRHKLEEEMRLAATLAGGRQ